MFFFAGSFTLVWGIFEDSLTLLHIFGKLFQSAHNAESVIGGWEEPVALVGSAVPPEEGPWT